MFKNIQLVQTNKTEYIIFLADPYSKHNGKIYQDRKWLQ